MLKIKNKSSLIIATLSILWVAFAFMTSQEWKLTKDYAIEFSSNDVAGVFKEVKGNVTFDKDQLGTSKFDFTVDLSSVNTGNEVQNGHLKNADWFDVKNYPNATFTTSSIVKAETGFLANGTFQLHGVKKELSIPISFEESEGNAIIKATFTFDRTDYKVGKKGDGVDEIMKINVSIPVTK
ncbi:MAG: YceI family protein [Fluviicola sp.]|jgi:polyisoprenoid-binding protein YceI|nr:YceI family protein [Fluviicola sp.]